MKNSMYFISLYKHYFQYTDNDEVLTKMYRTQMNLSENIKSKACVLFNLELPGPGSDLDYL